MSVQIKEIDNYIARAQPFAQPILNHIRTLVHKSCPQAEEKMKWGFPHFMYKNEMLCSMASFKQHCSFGFWKASLMTDVQLMENAKSESAMGHFGRITTLKDLPSDKKIESLIHEAMQLNDNGIKVEKKKAEKIAFEIPEELVAALNKNKTAKAVWDKFSYSHKKEYAQWVGEAKTSATKNKRIEKTLLYLQEGKDLNWKYK